MSKLTATLPFGRYKGTPLSAVPDDYIAFLLGKPDLFESTRAMLDAEVARRASMAPADRRDADDDGALPETLRGDEHASAWASCPACGRSLRVDVALAQATRRA